MADPNMRIIEIGGIKMEVDLRHARKIEELHVGDRVKVLVKGYGDVYTTYNGVICSFIPFEKLPTIVICYAKVEYSGSDLVFLNYTAKSADVEVVKAVDDELSDDILVNFHAGIKNKIIKLQREIEDLETKGAYFDRNFKSYWEAVGAPTLEENTDG